MDNTSHCLRALIPVHGDPLEVEVDGRPEVVSYPSAIVLFRFYEPFSILDIDDCTKCRPI